MFLLSLISRHEMRRGDEMNDANSFAIMYYHHLLHISSEIEINESVFSVFFFSLFFRGFPWFSMFSFIMPSLIPNGTSLMVNVQCLVHCEPKQLKSRRLEKARMLFRRGC